MQPVIERQILEDREVELVVHQRAGNMPRKRSMPFQGWNRARTEALVGDAVFLAHAQREGRVVVEEKSGGVIVEAEEQHVGPALGEPLRHRLVALEQRLPVRVVLPALVESDADGRHVRGADAADDFRHVRSRRAAPGCPPGFYAAAPAQAPSVRTGRPGRRRSACACRRWGFERAMASSVTRMSAPWQLAWTITARSILSVSCNFCSRSKGASGGQ